MPVWCLTRRFGPVFPLRVNGADYYVDASLAAPAVAFIDVSVVAPFETPVRTSDASVSVRSRFLALFPSCT